MQRLTHSANGWTLYYSPNRKPKKKKGAGRINIPPFRNELISSLVEVVGFHGDQDEGIVFQEWPDRGRECQSSAFQWVASPVEENGWLNFETATDVLPCFCLRQRARSLLQQLFCRVTSEVPALLEEEACDSFIMLYAIGNSE